jgi:hypothetical protein
MTYAAGRLFRAVWALVWCPAGQRLGFTFVFADYLWLLLAGSLENVNVVVVYFITNAMLFSFSLFCLCKKKLLTALLLPPLHSNTSLFSHNG